MEAEQLVGRIEIFVEDTMKGFSHPGEIEALEAIHQMIQAGKKVMPLCATCLYSHERFCCKLKRVAAVMPCVYWEEKAIGLDMIAY